jgi:hypothetical protein
LTQLKARLPQNQHEFRFFAGLLRRLNAMCILAVKQAPLASSQCSSEKVKEK